MSVCVLARVCYSQLLFMRLTELFADSCDSASELEKLKRDCESLQRECASLRSEREQLTTQQQKEKSSLQSECTSLRSENDQILRKLQQLEKELDRSMSHHSISHWYQKKKNPLLNLTIRSTLCGSLMEM